MFEFLRKYHLSKAKERLEIAKAEVEAINELFRRVQPTVGYADELIKAKKRVARYEYQVKCLSPSTPPLNTEEAP